MEEQKTDQENLIEKIKKYISLRSRIAVLSTVEKVAELYAATVSYVILTLCLLMALIFASLGCALWLGEQLNSTWMGFCMVGGIYLLLFLVVLIIKSKCIETPLMDQMVRKMLSEKNPDKNDD